MNTEENKEDKEKTQEELQQEKAYEQLDRYIDSLPNKDEARVMALHLAHINPSDVASFVLQYKGAKDKEARTRCLTVLHPIRNGALMEKLGHTFSEKTGVKAANTQKAIKYNMGGLQGTYTDPEKMDLTGWHFKAFDMDDPGSKFCKQFNLSGVEVVMGVMVGIEENNDTVAGHMGKVYKTLLGEKVEPEGTPPQ